MIQDRITEVRSRNKDVLAVHKKELCDRFQVKSEKADHDKVAQSRMYDRILAKCEGFDVPEQRPIENMRKEMCDRFKTSLADYIENGEEVAKTAVDGEPVKPFVFNFKGMLGQMAHRYCEVQPPVGDVVPPVAKLYEGYDIHGDKKTCQGMPPETACPAIFGPAERFAGKCKEANYEVYNCDCRTPLCSEKLSFVDDVVPIKTYTGYDLNGEKKTCTVLPAEACPAIFGPVERFAARCQELGFEVYGCDCRTQLCSQKLTGAQIAPIVPLVR